ncbi:hypothetical protein HTT03_09290 [Sulfitobacter sp. S0837]|uniref:hypothetical protein n=1 Tax=Sulfitobacter maritimus TaxID=2741719 RepID=UPI001581A2DA|nr:hypothetical protein [Sulfitobacter maritimus]NUH65479.1 hypothetical protein [Sulfitobacter maritimus]
MHCTPVRIAEAINANPLIYALGRVMDRNAVERHCHIRNGASFADSGFKAAFGHEVFLYYRGDKPVMEASHAMVAADALLNHLSARAARGDAGGDLGWQDPRHAWARFPARVHDTRPLAPAVALLDMPGARFVFNCLFVGAGCSMSPKLARLLSPAAPFVIFSSSTQAYNVIQNASGQMVRAGVNLAAFFQDMSRLTAPDPQRARKPAGLGAPRMCLTTA